MLHSLSLKKVIYLFRRKKTLYPCFHEEYVTSALQLFKVSRKNKITLLGTTTTEQV